MKSLIKKKIKSIFIFISLSFAFFCSLEISSLIVLNLWYKYRESTSTSYSNFVENWDFELHPSVGHAHEKEDFELNINARKSKEESSIYTRKVYGGIGSKKITILTLGGSTTDPLGNHFSGLEGTWPDHLGRKLSKISDKEIIILNAGVGAGTSSQELSRLINISFNNPAEIVISLNGLNELYFRNEIFKNNESIHASSMVLNGLREGSIRYDEKFYCSSKVCLPPIKSLNTVKLGRALISKIITSLNINPPKKPEKKEVFAITKTEIDKLKRASQIWKYNISTMHAIAKSNNSNYFVILQPSFGIGMSWDQINSMVKKEMSNNNSYKNINFRRKSRIYYERINILYSFLSQYCENIDYCINLSKIKNLNRDITLFSDPRHHNNEGNMLIAEKIADIITINKLLK